MMRLPSLLDCGSVRNNADTNVSNGDVLIDKFPKGVKNNELTDPLSDKIYRAICRHSLLSNIAQEARMSMSRYLHSLCGRKRFLRGYLENDDGSINETVLGILGVGTTQAMLLGTEGEAPSHPLSDHYCAISATVLYDVAVAIVITACKNRVTIDTATMETAGHGRRCTMVSSYLQSQGLCSDLLGEWVYYSLPEVASHPPESHEEWITMFEKIGTRKIDGTLEIRWSTFCMILFGQTALPLKRIDSDPTTSIATMSQAKTVLRESLTKLREKDIADPGRNHRLTNELLKDVYQSVMSRIGKRTDVRPYFPPSMYCTIVRSATLGGFRKQLEGLFEVGYLDETVIPSFKNSNVQPPPPAVQVDPGKANNHGPPGVVFYQVEFPDGDIRSPFVVAVVHNPFSLPYRIRQWDDFQRVPYVAGLAGRAQSIMRGSSIVRTDNDSYQFPIGSGTNPIFYPVDKCTPLEAEAMQVLRHIFRVQHLHSQEVADKKNSTTPSSHQRQLQGPYLPHTWVTNATLNLQSPFSQHNDADATHTCFDDEKHLFEHLPTSEMLQVGTLISTDPLLGYDDANFNKEITHTSLEYYADTDAKGNDKLTSYRLTFCDTTGEILTKTAEDVTIPSYAFHFMFTRANAPGVKHSPVYRHKQRSVCRQKFIRISSTCRAYTTPELGTTDLQSTCIPHCSLVPDTLPPGSKHEDRKRLVGWTSDDENPKQWLVFKDGALDALKMGNICSSGVPRVDDGELPERDDADSPPEASGNVGDKSSSPGAARGIGETTLGLGSMNGPSNWLRLGKQWITGNIRKIPYDLYKLYGFKPRGGEVSCDCPLFELLMDSDVLCHLFFEKKINVRVIASRCLPGAKFPGNEYAFGLPMKIDFYFYLPGKFYCRTVQVYLPMGLDSSVKTKYRDVINHKDLFGRPIVIGIVLTQLYKNTPMPILYRIEWALWAEETNYLFDKADDMGRERHGWDGRLKCCGSEGSTIDPGSSAPNFVNLGKGLAGAFLTYPNGQRIEGGLNRSIIELARIGAPVNVWVDFHKIVSRATEKELECVPRVKALWEKRHEKKDWDGLLMYLGVEKLIGWEYYVPQTSTLKRRREPAPPEPEYQTGENWAGGFPNDDEVPALIRRFGMEGTFWKEKHIRFETEQVFNDADWKEVAKNQLGGCHGESNAFRNYRTITVDLSDSEKFKMVLDANECMRAKSEKTTVDFVKSWIAEHHYEQLLDEETNCPGSDHENDCPGGDDVSTSSSRSSWCSEDESIDVEDDLVGTLDHPPKEKKADDDDLSWCSEDESIDVENDLVVTLDHPPKEKKADDDDLDLPFERYFGDRNCKYTEPKSEASKQKRLQECVRDIVVSAAYNMFAVAERIKGKGLLLTKGKVMACPLRDQRLGMPLRIKATPSTIRDLDLPCLAATTVAKELRVISANNNTQTRRLLYRRRHIVNGKDLLATEEVKTTVVNCCLFLFLGVTKTHRWFASECARKFPRLTHRVSFGLPSLEDDVLDFFDGLIDKIQEIVGPDRDLSLLKNHQFGGSLPDDLYSCPAKLKSFLRKFVYKLPDILCSILEQRDVSRGEGDSDSVEGAPLHHDIAKQLQEAHPYKRKGAHGWKFAAQALENNLSSIFCFEREERMWIAEETDANGKVIVGVAFAEGQEGGISNPNMELVKPETVTCGDLSKRCLAYLRGQTHRRKDTSLRNVHEIVLNVLRGEDADSGSSLLEFFGLAVFIHKKEKIFYSRINGRIMTAATLTEHILCKCGLLVRFHSSNFGFSKQPNGFSIECHPVLLPSEDGRNYYPMEWIGICWPVDSILAGVRAAFESRHSEGSLPFPMMITHDEGVSLSAEPPQWSEVMKGCEWPVPCRSIVTVSDSESDETSSHGVGGTNPIAHVHSARFARIVEIEGLLATNNRKRKRKRPVEEVVLLTQTGGDDIEGMAPGQNPRESGDDSVASSIIPTRTDGPHSVCVEDEDSFTSRYLMEKDQMVSCQPASPTSTRSDSEGPCTYCCSDDSDRYDDDGEEIL